VASRQEINISLCDELTLFDSQFRQQFLSDPLTFIFTLIGPEHDFQFQKISQAFHAVDVHSRRPNQVEDTGFLYFTDATQRLCEDIEQSLGVRSVRNVIVRRAGRRYVFSLVPNQFAAPGIKHSQLQTNFTTTKKEVMLHYRFWRSIALARNRGKNSISISQDCFDFDISRHIDRSTCEVGTEPLLPSPA
jgi:hypothetical protein